MAIAFVSAGTQASASPSSAPGVPASSALGHLWVMVNSLKYPDATVTVPASSGTGWFTMAETPAPYGGLGAAGVDSGMVKNILLGKIVDATLLAAIAGGQTTVPLQVGGNRSANSHRIFQFSKSAALAWIWEAVYGTDAVANTSWSSLASANPGVLVGDLMMAVASMNGPSANWSAEAITQAGLTYGATTERWDQFSNGGDHVGTMVCTASVSSGTASGNPMVTATLSASGANGPTGVTTFLRLREGAAGELAVSFRRPTLVAVGEITWGEGSVAIDTDGEEVAHLDIEKTIYIDITGGAATPGTVGVEVSLDGTTYVAASPLVRSSSIVKIAHSAQKMRIITQGLGAATIAVQARGPIRPQTFFTLPVPDGNDAGPSVDLNALSTDMRTIAVTGTWPMGVVSLEISDDNVTWVPSVESFSRAGIVTRRLFMRYARIRMAGFREDVAISGISVRIGG